jgi:LmbE family N-acetylglucosaminyl deacetylase
MVQIVMRKSFCVGCGLVLFFAVNLGAGTVQLNSSDRVLVLAPHPDDEVLGCGGVLQEAVEKKLPVRVVFFTNGDANQWAFVLYRKHPVIMPSAIEVMGDMRHGEAMRAAEVLGVSTNSLSFLGYPDFGTLAIWYKHWGTSPPAKGILSRATSVPYPDAYRPGAPYKGEEIIRDLTSIITDFRPTKIFLPHPADQNGDHAALYLFTRVSLWEMGNNAVAGNAELFPYLIHFSHWPSPRGCRATDPLVPPKQLAGQIVWRTHILTGPIVERKHQAIMQHRSQVKSSGRYLLSFMRSTEIFGDFPAVALSAARRVELTQATQAKQPMEQLMEVERAAFVGIEQRHISIEKEQVVINLDLSRPLAKEVEASIHLFGWRHDRPFGEMPKLSAKIGIGGISLYDQSRKLGDKTSQLVRSSSKVEVRIPLAELGNPERILTSARTSMAGVPLDWTAWRVVELEPMK